MVDDNAQRIQSTMKGNELTVQFENRIRQELGIGDTKDPYEFAAGLLKTYSGEKEALELEELGLPFTRIKVIGADERATGFTYREVDKAIDDVERDLQTLARDALLKDIDIELQAWGTAIRATIAEGFKAAEFALDPRERDRAFAARRALGNYARLARYVGVLTQGANRFYRQLAQSLDVVASLILVIMGESLAQAGARAGQFLLQAPASDLQERRDAVINALRALIGRQEGAGADGWPRGTEAYRQLLARLGEAGHADLRGLLREETMSQMLNQFVDIASGNDPASLRGLAATSHVLLERFHRLIHFSQMDIDPESPQLATLASALLLFLEAFENTSSGSRLLYVARPVILSYGHYGIGGPTQAVRILQDIIAGRGCLAELVDCYSDCGCDEKLIQCQVLLDKALYDLDRAIDLYALGSAIDADGPTESRASAYGALMLAISRLDACAATDSAISTTLISVARYLGWTETGKYTRGGNAKDLMDEELCLQLRSERSWEQLVRRMAPNCHQPRVFGGAEACGSRPGSGATLVKYIINKARRIVSKGTTAVTYTRARMAVSDLECPEYVLDIPAAIPTGIERLSDRPRKGPWKLRPTERFDVRPDKLTEISGIDGDLEHMLYKSGITTYAQIARWTDEDIERYEKEIPRLKGRIRGGNWVGQAKNLCPPLGIAEREYVSAPDDLTAIKGIGKDLEYKLYRSGILTYAQIASWSNDDIEYFEEAIIKPKGRIAKDDWVGQAKKLAK